MWRTLTCFVTIYTLSMWKKITNTMYVWARPYKFPSGSVRNASYWHFCQRQKAEITHSFNLIILAKLGNVSIVTSYQSFVSWAPRAWSSIHPYICRLRTLCSQPKDERTYLLPTTHTVICSWDAYASKNNDIEDPRKVQLFCINVIHSTRAISGQILMWLEFLISNLSPKLSNPSRAPRQEHFLQMGNTWYNSIFINTSIFCNSRHVLCF